MKKIIIMLFCLCIVLSCEGCSNQEDISLNNWDIQIVKAKAYDYLHTDAGITQYDGSVKNVAYDNYPSEGNIYMIITMCITKKENAEGTFDWKNLLLVVDGTDEYHRMNNDSFISSHTYNRMPGTSLVIGENKGSICFEIPSDSLNKSISLKYIEEDEEFIQEVEWEK